MTIKKCLEFRGGNCDGDEDDVRVALFVQVMNGNFLLLLSPCEIIKEIVDDLMIEIFNLLPGMNFVRD